MTILMNLMANFGVASRIKLLRSAVLLAFASLVGVFCAQGNPAGANRDVVNLATEEYAPYTSSKMKEQGVDCQIIKEAFSLSGKTTNFVFHSGARSFEMAKLGQVHGTVPWAKREGRENDFYYSDPVIESGQEYFFFLSDKAILWDFRKQNYGALKGLRVGAIISHNYKKNFQEAEKKKIIIVERVSSSKQNFKKLASSKKFVGEFRGRQCP